MKIELFGDRSFGLLSGDMSRLLIEKVRPRYPGYAANMADSIIDILKEFKRPKKLSVDISVSDCDRKIYAEFILRGYSCSFSLEFPRPLRICNHVENTAFAAMFLALYKEAAAAYYLIEQRQPKFYIKHCKAVARQVDIYARRIKNELQKYCRP